MLLNIIGILLFNVNMSQYHSGYVVPFRLLYLIIKFLSLEIPCRIIVKCCCECQTTQQPKPHGVKGKSTEK